MCLISCPACGFSGYCSTFRMLSLPKFKLVMSRLRDFLPPVALLGRADVGKFQEYNSRMGFFISLRISVF